MANCSEYTTKHGFILLLSKSNYDNFSLKYLSKFYREIFIFAKELLLYRATAP